MSVEPKTVVKPYSNPKDSPLGTQKVKNDPKNESKSNIGIEGTLENKSCYSRWVDPKTVFEQYPDSKCSPLGPQKVKNDPKIKTVLELIKNEKIELKKT